MANRTALSRSQTKSSGITCRSMSRVKHKARISSCSTTSSGGAPSCCPPSSLFENQKSPTHVCRQGRASSKGGIGTKCAICRYGFSSHGQRAFVPGYTLRRTFVMSSSEKNGCKAISSKSGRDASFSSIIFVEGRLVSPLCRR